MVAVMVKTIPYMIVSILWKRKYDDAMMMQSTNCMARPKLRRKYLFSSTVRISVPPVEPLCENTMPRPAPPRKPAISTCINLSSPGVIIGCAAKNGCNMLIIKDMMPTPMIVRQKNCFVSADMAMTSINMLSASTDVPAGMFVA